MRRVLVDHARQAKARKRDGGCNIPFELLLLYVDEQPRELLAIDEMLGRLAQLDPRQAEVVELRFFGGALRKRSPKSWVSVRTVKRVWRVARAWLYAS
jgi:RNA polymerase sigma-70 factor (ECF subfamily)